MSSSKERISKLKCLVDELSDRDRQLKADASMFEDFFKNFPIPVTMWSLDSSGNVLSKRGNTVIKDECTSLENMFLKDYSQDFMDAHRKALAGEPTSFFSVLPDNTYYTRLVPRKKSGSVTGITGISWNITSNYKIIETLQQIVDFSKNSDHDVCKRIQALAETALNASRIKKLLEKDDSNGQ